MYQSGKNVSFISAVSIGIGTMVGAGLMHKIHDEIENIVHRDKRGSK